ncbi:MAG: hypothetical protein JWO38_1902 [Gemmataceae bacterium]|nr:hypothetical protein [Gemmataceae bacterium]
MNDENGLTRPPLTASEHPVRVPDPEDDRHLANLEKKLAVIRDRVCGVVAGSSTGLFVHGDGGIGKSFSIIRELNRLEADFKLWNSRMTGRGLFDTLEAFPETVHVLEDMHQLVRDQGAVGVLLSALWGQRRDGDRGPVERRVTWATDCMMHAFTFTGAIIMTANRPLHDRPELNAIRTRIACLHLTASDQELRAQMRHLARAGYQSDGRELTPGECQEVVGFLIAEALQLNASLDLRLMTHAYADFLEWQDDRTRCDWRDLIRTRLRERPTGLRHEVIEPSVRALRRKEETALVREIVAACTDPSEQVRRWKEATGKSQAAWYRRLGELKR